MFCEFIRVHRLILANFPFYLHINCGLLLMYSLVNRLVSLHHWSDRHTANLDCKPHLLFRGFDFFEFDSFDKTKI